MAIFETTRKRWGMVTGKNPAEVKSDGLPIAMVPHADACGKDGFAKALPSKTNIGSLGLPTEAQWGHASRAGAVTKAAIENRNGIIEVGLTQSNAWGLHDMQGNAWERCKDPGNPMRGIDAFTMTPAPSRAIGRIRRSQLLRT